MTASSSLPDNTGGHTPGRPADGLSNNSSISDPLHASHAPEDTLLSRKRATTGAGLPPGTLLGRRFGAENQRTNPPNVPHFKHLKLQDDTLFSPKPIPLHSTLRDEPPSAPITIPVRRTSPSPRLITPQTGRERTFFAHAPKQCHTPPPQAKAKDFTPSPDSPAGSSQSEQEVFAHSPILPRAMRPDQGEASPMYTPSSPLSPTRVTCTASPWHKTNAGAKPSNGRPRGQPEPLAIPSLPPFHPANYESRSGSARSVRPISSAHGRQLSDAQKKLQRYQRELVINATRTAGSSTAGSPVPRPNSPRLNPTLASPGPMTPLALEGQTDYFIAGSNTASSSALQDSERRAAVERMIAAERDRIAHPGRADRHSPAVSPAGGPG